MMESKPDVKFDVINSWKTGHCRLCANMNYTTDLIDFHSDVAVTRNLLAKLYKIRVVVCENDDLPTCICNDCMEELDQVVNFLDRVESSQITLRTMLCDIKPLLNITEEPKTEINTEVPIETFIEPNIKNIIDDKVDPEVLSLEASKSEDWELNCGSDLDYEEEDNKPLKKLKKVKKHDIKKWTDNTFPTTKTWLEYPWICYSCNTQLDNVNLLKEHTKKVHFVCCTYKCVDCTSKRFVNHQTFIKHVGEHRINLKKCCFQCGNIYKSKFDLKQHLLDDHNEEYVCRVCGDRFLDSDELKNHIETFGKYYKPRRLTPEDLVCKYCGKTCKNSSNLKVHVSTHEERTRDHTCHLCGKAFYNKGTLLSHLDAHANKRPFSCNLCDKRFPTKNKLNRHIETHSDFKSISCETCGRLFRNKYQLKYHQIVHTDEMPFDCGFCDKRFKFKSVWKTHQNQHTGNRPYECIECSHSFTNQSNYAKHMLRRHGVKIGSRRNIIKKDPVVGESSSLINVNCLPSLSN